MNKSHFSLIIIFSVVLTIILLFTLSGQRIHLIALEDLNLYDRIDQEKIVAHIRSGEKVPVVACDDLKHYMAPVVRFGEKDAYVIDGAFRLVRGRVWDFDAGPLSFSCS